MRMGVIPQPSPLLCLAQVESHQLRSSLFSLELSVLREPRSVAALSAEYVTFLPGDDAVR